MLVARDQGGDPTRTEASLGIPSAVLCGLFQI